MPSDPADAVIAPAVRVRVPAKVNLHLGVGAVRPDGYHELVNLFHAVDLVDDVVARASDHMSITVSGEGVDDVPLDARNLAWRAALLLADACGVPPRAAVEIKKSIPVAGGMAGGSADGAAALLACARLWNLDVSVAELAGLASRLGSDANFALLGGTALGTGRGEVVTTVTCATVLHWVFALADHGLSAAAAYAELDRLREREAAPTPSGPVDGLLAALADGDLERVAACLANDLQAAAISLSPGLAETLAAGERHGALAGLVSGSGPTCAFLCRDAGSATLLAAELEAEGVCRTARVARGPAPGARVVG